MRFNILWQNSCRMETLNWRGHAGKITQLSWIGLCLKSISFGLNLHGHTHTQVQLPTVCRHAVQMPQVQAIAINPTSQLSFFHSCHLQTATASNSSNPSFCTFQSKKICSACGKGANNRYTSAGFTSSSCEDQHGCLSLSIRAARTPS